MPTASDGSIHLNFMGNISSLRSYYRQQRASLSPLSRREQSARVCSHLRDFFSRQSISSIGIYWPIEDELETRDLWRDWLAIGWQLALPCTTKKEPLIFRAFHEQTPMQRGLFDIFEPMPQSPVLRPHWLLVPAMALDSSGGRIGYGGGYYDRTLASWRADNWRGFSIGICFSSQFSSTPLPQSPHDMALDGVLTPEGWQKPLADFQTSLGVTKA